MTAGRSVLGALGRPTVHPSSGGGDLPSPLPSAEASQPGVSKYQTLPPFALATTSQNPRGWAAIDPGCAAQMAADAIGEMTHR